MIIILCIDDNNGMMFHHRRQSQDRLLREQLLQSIGKNKLWMSAYSKNQFADIHAPQIIADDNFPEKAGDGDYCFVEDRDICGCIDKIQKIILYKWNRRYPADTFFTLDIRKWTLEESEDFAGYSHEKITKEVYRR